MVNVDLVFEWIWRQAFDLMRTLEDYDWFKWGASIKYVLIHLIHDASSWPDYLWTYFMETPYKQEAQGRWTRVFGLLISKVLKVIYRLTAILGDNWIMKRQIYTFPNLNLQRVVSLKCFHRIKLHAFVP